MFNRIRQFARLDASQKLVFIQAWCLLGWMRAAIFTVSFKRLTASLEHHKVVVTPPELEIDQLKEAGRIGKLVAVAAKYTPWQSPCLTQVLTLQRLLARRGIAGQFYLGVRKGGEEGASPVGLAAHAWLQCDDFIVNGGGGHQEFTVLSTFSWGRS